MTSTSSLLKATVAAFVVSVLGDYLWHNVLLLSFYGPRLMELNGVAASTAFPLSLLFIELVVSFGMAYFILKTSHSYTHAFWNGLFLGLLTVGTLNFVNHSILVRWDMTLAIVDTLWGIGLGGIGGLVVFWTAKKA